MILTVTLNPCIDRTLTVSNFREGGTTPVSATRTEIGGKGLNVSRALKNLGAPTLCLGFSHEKGGSDLRSTLDESAIPYDLEEIPGELRMNIKIFDESNRTMSELNDKGCPVSEDAVNRMIDRIVSHFKDAELLVLAGSVPPGVPADIYKILLEKAKDYDLPVILDASGALLLNGIEGKPWLIKPNIDELSATLGREFHSREEIIQAGIALKELFLSHCPKAKLILDEATVVEVPAMFFTAAMNLPYEGGGFQFCPKADPKDDRLDLILVEKMPKLKILCLLPTAFFGKHTRFHGVHIYTFKEATLITERPLFLHTDGEIPGKTMEATWRLLPEKLSMILG